MNPTTIPISMTADAFVRPAHRPENQGRHSELERGKVIEMSRPGERHGVVCRNVTYVLGGYVRQRGRGRVLTNDPGLLLVSDPDTIREPDLRCYADNRPYDQLDPKYAEGKPVLAVEVLSPTDRIGRVLRRVAEYLRARFVAVWIIDPETRDFTVPRRASQLGLNEGYGRLDGGDELPGFSARWETSFSSPRGA